MDAQPFYIIGIFIGVILNMVVVLVLLSKKREVNHLDLTIVSLCLSDIFQAGVGYSVEIYSFYQDEGPSKQLCEISGFTITFLAFVSICHLVGLSIERYIILKFPLKARVWYGQPQIALYIVIPSWVYAFFCALPPLVGWSSYRRINNSSHLCQVDLTTSQNNSLTYLWFLLGSCFVLPLVFITSFSLLLLRESRNTLNEISSLGGISEANIVRRQKKEKELSYMTLAFIAAYVISWLPYAICVFLSSAQKDVKYISLSASGIFAKLSILYNPFILLFMNRSFRSRCRYFFCCGSAPKRENTQTSQTTVVRGDADMSKSCTTLASTTDMELATITQDKKQNDVGKTATSSFDTPKPTTDK